LRLARRTGPIRAPAGAAGPICLACAKGRGFTDRRPAGACHPLTTEKGTVMTLVEASLTIMLSAGAMAPSPHSSADVTFCRQLPAA
jgi:hypothetical protein